MTDLVKYVRLQDGCVMGGGSGLTVPDGCMQVPPDISLSALASLMLTEAGWAQRPALADPAVVTVAGGVDVSFVECPQGTFFEVTSLTSGQIVQTITAAGAVSIHLPGPGRYRVEALPPLPFLPMTLGYTVEVLAGGN